MDIKRLKANQRIALHFVEAVKHALIITPGLNASAFIQLWNYLFMHIVIVATSSGPRFRLI